MIFGLRIHLTRAREFHLYVWNFHGVAGIRVGVVGPGRTLPILAHQALDVHNDNRRNGGITW